MVIGQETAPEAGAPSQMWRALDRLPRSRLLLYTTLTLFVLAAFPLLLVETPPLQDLPNHLATLTVIQHPDLYPEYAFNGFFKTNSAFFAWLVVMSPLVGARVAAKIFIAGVLLLMAWVIPRTIYKETEQRGAVVAGSLLAFPLVHNWFVSAGMLDFALSVPLALLLLGLANEQARTPTPRRAAAIGALAIVTWFAHSMGLLIAGLLFIVSWLFSKSWRGRKREGLRSILFPLMPAGTLVGLSIFEQVSSVALDPWATPVRFRSFPVTWELVYNFWSETYWSFTKLSILSIVPCVVLTVLGCKYFRKGEGVFAIPGLLALGALSIFVPYVFDNWFHVNSRFFLFVFVFFLVRLPPKLPRPLLALLAVSALTVSAGNAVDYVRLAREQRELDAAIPDVKEGARLLPLLFRQKNTSENTRNLIHAWGDYVVAKHTSAPLLFAHSRSFPVTYRAAPPPRFNHLILESTAARLRSSADFCELIKERRSFVLGDCQKTYESMWREFWIDALPRFDHVLTWDASEEALANVPKEYKLVREAGRTRLYVRDDSPLPSAPKP